MILKKDDCKIDESVVYEVLEKIFERLQEKPMNRVLRRILIAIVLASMMSNYHVTFQFLESKNLTSDFMESILKLSVKKMDNLLERRLFTMTLTSLLTQSELPDTVRDKSPKIISKIIDMLVRTTIDEAKKARKKDKKIDHKEDDFSSDSEDESSDEDFSDYDEEEDKENSNAPSLSALGMEEAKGEYAGDGDSTDGDEGDEVLEAEIDVQSNFAIMKTGLNSFDEFKYFQHVITELYKNHHEQMEMLVSQLSDTSQLSLRGLIQVKKFDVGNGVVHRRVVQVRRRK